MTELISKYSIDHWLVITAISSVVIAVVSLLFSTWQASATRKHNMLSVKPILCFYTSLNGTRFDNGIHLGNAGVGPAIVQEFTIYVDKKEIISKKLNVWSEALDRLNLLESDLNFGIYRKGQTLTPNESFFIFGVLKDKYNHDRFLLVRNSIDRINFRIRYTSLYGQKYEAWYHSEMKEDELLTE